MDDVTVVAGDTTAADDVDTGGDGDVDAAAAVVGEGSGSGSSGGGQVGKKSSSWDRVKGPWSPEEDAILSRLVSDFGARNWSLIARGISGRSGKSCRLRWCNQLDPAVKRKPFTDEEDRIIVQAHTIHGNKWASIARLLQGRTDNAIKNHWNSTLRRRCMARGKFKLESSNMVEDISLDKSKASSEDTLSCGDVNSFKSFEGKDVSSGENMEEPWEGKAQPQGQSSIEEKPKPTDTGPSRSPPKVVNGSPRSSPPKAVNGASTRMENVSKEIKRVRAQMEENEQLAILMKGLRGQNLRDSQFADDNIQLRLVEVDESSEFLPLVYDPATISAYWGKRPRAVATRIVQLLSVAGGFLSRLAWDVINKKVKENEVARAIELREIVTSLGPAYIKLGQALSIRPDILSPAAMTELQKLCDKVPSFPDDVAMALIEEELGQPWYNIYSELTSSPIAAASLGQVYKGRLKENGDLVAVKVQRPFVLETVTVDLFVIRNLGLVLRKFPQVSIDVVGLVDEWAARFFEELDYVNEGENGTFFAEMMKKDLPQVVVPKTYNKYTSRKVLTTQWVEGEKLSQSKESDVGELVNVGVICYLKQLLDTGFFHADPHPGNMIRTPDGKLCILDFGLVTKLTDDQKYGMIEAIAHLIHRDYAAIVKDFVKLGFIPDGVNLEPILPVLAKVFDQALEGGGAKNINFQELASDLAQITFDYPFRIPPYFALIIRAIGVLEGIALVGDPDFAIVDEAYPYIAQRLLTDESPRLRSALRYTIYGKSGVFDAERFIDVMQAFENFITAAKSGGGEDLNGDMAELGILQIQRSNVPVFPFSSSQSEQPIQTRAALAFLLSEKGNFFREFLLDEIVKAIDAVAREQLVRIMAVLGIGNAAPVFSMVPALGPIRPVGLVPTVTEEDEVILNNVQKIIEFLTAGSSASRSSNQTVNVTQAVQELLPVLPGISAKVLPEVITRLSSRVMARIIRDTFIR